MPNITNLFIDIDGKKLSKEEYKAHSDNAACGIDHLVSGIKAVANLMFWAASNEQYNDENSDMQNISLLLTANISLLEKMLEIESCANFNLSQGKKDEKPLDKFGSGFNAR